MKSSPGLPVGSEQDLEVQLFQLAARRSLDDAAARRLDDLLTRQLDWKRVLSAGGAHGILPLMSLHLAEREAVPESARHALRERCERVARSNLYLCSQLRDIVTALEAEGIPALVLKGPAVAATLYDNLLLREYGDLDLLVSRSDAGRAVEALVSMGFRPWKETAGGQSVLLPHVDYSRSFTRPGDDLDLDLHWDLARSFFRGRVEADALWEDTRSFDLHGKRLRCLSDELLLPALCVHGAKHGPFPWPRMKWVCDVAEFVRGAHEFDWEKLLIRAAALGSRRTTLFGLAVSRPLVEGELPAPVEAQLAHESQIDAVAGRVWEWLASETQVSLSFLERAAIDLTVIDSGPGRLSYALRRILTPTRKDWTARRLPRRLAFLYVPLRLARLIRTYAPAPWRVRRLTRRSSARSDGSGVS